MSRNHDDRKKPFNQKKALTTGEVAKYCGVNFRTVIRWIEKGRLEAYKLPGRGDNRVPIENFINFLVDNQIPIPEELNSFLIQEEKLTPNEHTKILIVDDDELMSRAIKRHLSTEGYEIQIAHNGVEAGIHLESFKPNLITLDLHMPAMNGLELLDVLKSQKKYESIKIIVISSASADHKAKALLHGADEVMDKPFSNKDLIENIRLLLG